MITLSIDPVLFSIGHFSLRWYGLIVTAALAIGLWVTGREAKRVGLDEEHFSGAVVWVILAALVGARLFHVIDHWPDEFAANPLRVLYIWEGGLAIWGGVLGGLAALMLYARTHRLSLAKLVDIGAPGLVLGQGLGRIACVITGDAMGAATNGPLGIAYTNPSVMVPQLGVYYTPVPLYELVMDVSIFALLWNLRRRDLPQGALFLIYLLLYSAGHFVLTFWSRYPTVALGMNQAQLVGLGVSLIALPWLVYLLRRGKAQPVVAMQ